MAKKRKNFIREKRIYCGEEYLEVDIVAVTNMPEAGKGKKGKSSQAQKNLNDKRSKRRFVQIANTNFGTNDFHISATYNNEHLPIIRHSLRSIWRDRMVYRNKEGYADPTAGAAIHEAEPKAKKKEYNPEVTNLVSVLKQMIDIAGYEMVGRIVLRDKDTGKEYR